MKEKGFTLVELLAVIVILTIISLIAVPMILNVIDESRKKAAIVSAENYIYAVEQYLVLQEVENYNVKLENNTTYKVEEDTVFEFSLMDIIIPKVYALPSETVFLNDIIKIKGEYPKDGYVEIGENKITAAELVSNNYIVTCTSSTDCEITGNYSSNIVASDSIKINEVGKTKLLIGETLQLSAKVLPEDATNKKVRWTSSNNEIATVDANGLVTAISSGTVTITATTNNRKTDTIELTIKGTLKTSLLENNDVITSVPNTNTTFSESNDAAGLYVSNDTNSGDPTYYFRGNVENNYVKFANMEWRIVRINEDNTIRLILSEGINSNEAYAYQQYSSSDKGYYLNHDDFKPYIDSWYISKLTSFSSDIVTGNYFCGEIKAKYEDGADMDNAVSFTDYNPSFKCKDEYLYNLNIALLTYDEAVFAGAYKNNTSESTVYSYLNGINSWLMTPAGYYSSSSLSSSLAKYYGPRIWLMQNDSLNGMYSYNNQKYSLRPVINLKSNVSFSGTGTQIDPYVIS